MAHSLEVREPLMDHKLIEWLATLPTQLKIRGQEGSSCSRRRWSRCCRRCAVPPEDGFFGAAGALVPRPLKQRVREAVLGERSRRRMVQREVLQHLVDAHQSGATTTARRCGRC